MHVLKEVRLELLCDFLVQHCNFSESSLSSFTADMLFNVFKKDLEV